jgi:hypothetical protein
MLEVLAHSAIPSLLFYACVKWNILRKYAAQPVEAA